MYHTFLVLTRRFLPPLPAPTQVVIEMIGASVADGLDIREREQLLSAFAASAGIPVGKVEMEVRHYVHSQIAVSTPSGEAPDSATMNKALESALGGWVAAGDVQMDLVAGGRRLADDSWL